MQFYVIPPLKNKNLMHFGDRFFCLAQLFINDPEYRKFFLDLRESKPDAWITLDNGAGDHELVSEDQLLKVTRQLMPNEVIPPDYLFDSKKTIKGAQSFYAKMKVAGLNKKVGVFFCPQGKRLEDWIECYMWGLDQPWISVMGWSKIAVPYAFLGVKDDVGIMEARHMAFNYCKIHQLFKKPVHLLGMGSPKEFEYYSQFAEGRWIRSSDSCNSVWSAMNGIDWSVDRKPKRIPTPRNYFKRVASDNNMPIVMRNISELKRIGQLFH